MTNFDDQTDEVWKAYKDALKPGSTTLKKDEVWDIKSPSASQPMKPILHSKIPDDENENADTWNDQKEIIKVCARHLVGPREEQESADRSRGLHARWQDRRLDVELEAPGRPQGQGLGPRRALLIAHTARSVLPATTSR